MIIRNPWFGEGCSGQYLWTMQQILDCVGEGWAVILDDLVKDLEKLGWDGDLFQVKEKFGGLRFYIGNGNDAIHARIAEAEDLSFKTCETCGEPGKHSGWGTGWLLTLCDQHGAEREAEAKRWDEKVEGKQEVK